jgi:hypothetical protein
MMALYDGPLVIVFLIIYDKFIKYGISAEVEVNTTAEL